MNKPVKQSNPRNIVSASPTSVGVVQNPCQDQGGNRSGADFGRSALPANRGLFYDGGWHEAESGRHIAVQSPSTGESLGEIADGDAADIAAVVASAKKGFGLWRDVHPLERAAILRQIAEIVRRNARELAAIDAIDCGNPFTAFRPKSRGRIRLTGPNPTDAVQIETKMMSHPDDVKAAIAGVQLCREIGNSVVFRPFVKREVMPGNLKGAELENFIRDSVVTFWHQTCTAKMGRDSMAVVDANLKVYGIENLRIADGSIMPRVTTGNTMAPCVIIGERAGEILKADHKL